MAEMTIEQKRAIAMANARLRVQEQSQPQEQEADLADKLVGSSTGRFFLGAADPILSTTARAAAAFGDKSGMEAMARLDEMKKRGSKALGSEGFDFTGLVGNIMSPVSMATMNVAPAATVPGRIVQGMETGAVLGGTAHAKEGEDTKSWLGHMGLGGLLGGAISGGAELVKPTYNILRSIFGNKDSNAGKVLNDIAGSKREDVIKAMQDAQTRVPGEHLTAGEAAISAKSPEFSAMQEISANRIPGRYKTGGIEGRNEEARQALIAKYAGTPDDIAAAEALRAAQTKPMRETALANANLSAQKADELGARLSSQKNAVVSALQDKGRFQTIGAQQEVLANKFTPVEGMPRISGKYSLNAERVPEAASAAAETAGIESARKAQAGLTKYQLESLAAHGQYPLEAKSIVNVLDAKMSSPGERASDVVTKTLGAVKEKISSLTNDKGVIDARDLYTIRKEIGNTISQFSKETANWDKRLASKLEGGVQKAIDDAIETAGGSGWKNYLRKYVEMSAPIENMRSAQVMQKALTEPLGVSERPAAFARASLNADNPVTNAQTQVAIDAITKSLSREALHSKLAKEGVESVNRTIGSELPKIPPTGAFNPKISMGRAAINRAHDKATDAIIQHIAENMDNPQKVIQMMQKANPAQRDAVIQALMKAKNPAIAGAVYMGGH